MTGVPSGRRVSSAAAAQTVPMTVPERTSSGSVSPGTPSVASTSDGQSSSIRWAPVLSALLRSVGTSWPTRRRLTKSLWCSSLTPLRPYSPSSQSSFGSAHAACMRR